MGQVWAAITQPPGDSELQGVVERAVRSRRHQLLTLTQHPCPCQVVSSAIPDDQRWAICLQQPQGVGVDRDVSTPVRDSARAGTQQGALHAETEVSAERCTLAAYREQRPQMEQDGKPAPLSPACAHTPEAEDGHPSPSWLQRTGEGCAEPLVTVTVQCAFTVALRTRRGADLSSLRALLGQALPHQAQLGQLRWEGPAQVGVGSALGTTLAEVAVEEGVAEVTVLPAGPTHTAPSEESLCSYQAPGEDEHWVPIPGEESLQRAWLDTAASRWGLQLQCRPTILLQGAGGRPVLYQVVAQHGYSAQGPEDLDFRQGATVDVLCEGTVGMALPKQHWGTRVDQAWLEGHCDGRIGIFPKCFVVPAHPRMSGAPGYLPQSQQGDQP
ncbi:hypothetical protein P7K49_002226 [Saguinus oedipus]|uniref:SH3 domain-containing protein n=1 Tax=Saguinus oedipus TaxID=9490 RepID=A0ABQ9WHC8_SAGOE|nr:hypothetical protein P7K49_002226 [Saguinus oedipus]